MRRGFLIDMDGVIYRGSELIPGADTFVNRLLRHDIPFVFLTNNSQRTRRDVVTKLRRLGIIVGDQHVFTCAMATARFLAQQKPHGTAFVIGEGGLLTALHQNGYSVVDHSPDYVVVGEGRTLTLEMLETAVQMILQGARLIATNPDPNCQKTISQGGRAADKVHTSASYFNPCAFGIPSGAFGNLGRNVFRGPHVVNLDFSMFKSFPVKEEWNLQLRFEAFNVLNIQNWDAPSALVVNTNATSIAANVGRVTGLAQGTTPRQLQFGLRFVF